MKTFLNDPLEHIEYLSTYKENDKLQEFNILHLYPGDLAWPNGYVDSRFFNLIGFNHNTMERRDLGKRDGLRFAPNVTVMLVRIFADGSTLIRFWKPVWVELFQCANVVAAPEVILEDYRG